MTGGLVVISAGPASTVQDTGRFGVLALGLSASGPMDAAGFARAGALLHRAGTAGIEFTTGGIGLEIRGTSVGVAGAGGGFVVHSSIRPLGWPFQTRLNPGDVIEIVAGPSGNFGYLRFTEELAVPLVLGSRSTNLRAGLGGLSGRSLRAGDEIPFMPNQEAAAPPVAQDPVPAGPIRFLWGLHADLFTREVRQSLCASHFEVSGKMDRMGMRLTDPRGVFAGESGLSLVSDIVVPGDIQILGDGTPVILGRDHQPTGGYPRIGTVFGPDLDRLFQMRPGTQLTFEPISLSRARRLMRGLST